MTAIPAHILIVNGGSSSIKFAVFALHNTPKRDWHGHLDRIGQTGTSLTVTDPFGDRKTHLVAATDVPAAVAFLVDWLRKQPFFGTIRAVGHRIVHGMAHTQAERITPDLLTDLRRTMPVDPDHLPGEIALIEAIQTLWPDMLQIACFDTAFHQTLPRVAQLLPIPRRFDARGIRRYGFHGLSYTYLLGELTRLAGADVAQGRVILVHLGSGASLAAVRNGESVDTTMGFTPTGGLMMGTRTGDLDPGTLAYLIQSTELTATQVNHLINHESGLLGVSETSSDMRDLLVSQATDSRATEAIELFCYQVKKGIGAYAAILDGLDTLVFSGGIGENAPEVRARICAGLSFLGITIDDRRNAANAAIISTNASRVTVRVIPTDEERVMADVVSTFLN